MVETPLASLSLTHVHYNPDDPLSFLSAWLALVPQALCVAYVTLIWATREVEVLLMFAGQMGCEALNFLLKRIIKEERPRQMNGKGYGMPSSHAQFISFFAIYLALFLLFRHKPEPPTLTTKSASFHTLFCLSLCACLAAGASAVAASRIYLNYHTPKQVLVGCSAGVGCAVAWFLVTGFLRSSGWIDWGLDFAAARMLRVRDLVVSEDLAEAGWQRWERKRLLKRRGVVSDTRESEREREHASTKSD